MKKKEQQQVLAILKGAINNSRKEQDAYIGRIAALKVKGNSDYLKKLSSMGWNGIAEAMADERYPAKDQDYDENPNSIKVDLIENFDIRCSTNFLNEIVEHTCRIKSRARFVELLCAQPEDPYASMLYGFWVKHNVYSQLALEQTEEGNTNKADTLMQVANAWSGAFEVFAICPKLSEIIPLK